MVNYSFDESIGTDSILPRSGNTLLVGNDNTILILAGATTSIGDSSNPMTILGDPLVLGPGEIRISGTGTLLTAFPIELVNNSSSAFSIQQGAEQYLNIDTDSNLIEFGMPTEVDSTLRINGSSGTQFYIFSDVTGPGHIFMQCNVLADSIFTLFGSGNVSTAGNLEFTAGSNITFLTNTSDSLIFRDSGLVQYMSLHSVTGSKEVRFNQRIAFPETTNYVHLRADLVDALTFREFSGLQRTLVRLDTETPAYIDVYQAATFRNTTTTSLAYSLMASDPKVLTTDEVICGLMEVDSGVGWTVTFPTGLDLRNALVNPMVGQSFVFRIANVSAINALTVVDGGGVTHTNDGYVIVPTQTTKSYIFRLVDLNGAPYFRVFS